MKTGTLVYHRGLFLFLVFPGKSRVKQFIYLAPFNISLMRYMKWVGLVAAAVLIISCFIPWVVIESRNITVSGTDAAGTNYGKPGYFHLLLAAIFLFCTLLQKVWAKRLNLLITALNAGWALRNFFIISACQGGECPDKKSGIYLMLFASVLMLVSSLFPDMKMPQTKAKQ